MFLRDVDQPLLRLPVAPVSAPPKKPEIWKAFQRLVVKKIGRLLSPRIEDSGRPEFQFDVRFLMALRHDKRWPRPEPPFATEADLLSRHGE